MHGFRGSGLLLRHRILHFHGALAPEAPNRSTASLSDRGLAAPLDPPRPRACRFSSTRVLRAQALDLLTAKSDPNAAMLAPSPIERSEFAPNPAKRAERHLWHVQPPRGSAAPLTTRSSAWPLAPFTRRSNRYTQKLENAPTHSKQKPAIPPNRDKNPFSKSLSFSPNLRLRGCNRSKRVHSGHLHRRCLTR